MQMVIRQGLEAVMPARKDMPSTLQRSPDKAQRTWAKTHDAAVETYGEGERSHRTAFASLKNKFEKVGDHWEPKGQGRKGPSDEQAARGQAQNEVPTAGGVDANAPKEHLMEVAKRLDIKGRSSMNKGELVNAIQRANNRETAQARGRRR
jgi:ChaB/Rho termination factor, N-terminal domain